MNPNYDGISHTSRDLGAWTADVTDIGGVDEISLGMKAAAFLHDAFLVNHVHQSASFLTGDDTVFENDVMTAPQVIGGSPASSGTADVFRGKDYFEDDQIVTPPTIGEQGQRRLQ